MCRACEQRKPLHDFNICRAKKDGRQGICRDCQKDYRKTPAYKDSLKRSVQKWFKVNPTYHIESHLKRKYGLSLEVRHSLFQAQGCKCPICGVVDLPFKDWAVDHDHETGEVRGILCRKCNSGLGLFKDNPTTVLSAYSYLIGRIDNNEQSTSKVISIDSSIGFVDARAA